MAVKVAASADGGDLFRRHGLCDRVLGQLGRQLVAMLMKMIDFSVYGHQVGQRRLAAAALEFLARVVLEDRFKRRKHLLSLVVLELGLVRHVHFRELLGG